MNMRHHFRRRTPEEDIATLDREPHAFGPLGMALINVAGYGILKPESAELLIYAATEAGIALGGVAYVHHRVKRGLMKLKPDARPLPKTSAFGFFGADIVPFVGITGFVGGAQAGLSATLGMAGIVRANESDLIQSLSDSMVLGAGSALLLGSGSVAAMIHITRGETSPPEVSVEKEDPIC